MAESAWKVRIMLFVRAPRLDNQAELDAFEVTKDTFAAILSNNGSGEDESDERKLFNSVIRLSTTGIPPRQVFGIETAVLLPNMRADMESFLDTLAQSRYYVIANYDLPQYFAGELIKDNKAAASQPTLVGVPPWDTTPFTMQDALADLEAERGLLVIPDAV